MSRENHIYEPDWSGRTDQLCSVNKPVIKKDALALVTGKPVYVDDLAPKDCLIVKVLRSPHANAIVKSVKKTAAERVPGIEAIYTWEDVPKQRFTMAGQTYPEPSPYDRLILDQHVRYVGDPVAIIAGKDEKCVDRARKLLKVEYEVLPAILDFHQSKDNELLVHPEESWKSLCPVGADNQRNLCASAEDHNGDVEAVLAECDEVVEHTYHVRAAQQAMMETFRTYCFMDTYGRLNVLSSTQIVYHARRILSNALGIPKSKIRVSKPRIGGGFGAKQTVVAEIFPAFVTWKTGKPSKMIFTREESQTASTPRHEMEVTIRLGAMKDGRIRAIDLYTLSNTGAYGEHGPTTVGLSGHKSIPMYGSLEAYRFAYDVVYSNVMSAGAYRGYGATQGIFAVESAVSEMAARLGIDPIRIREQNMVREGQFMPAYYGETANSCALDQCVERAKEMIGWDEKYPCRDMGNGKVRGVGLAMAMQGSSIANVDVGGATLKLNEDASYTLSLGCADMGTGCDTILSQMAADCLETEFENIVAFGVDTDVSPYDSGSYASATTYATGNAVINACNELKKRIIRLGAEMLGVSPEEADFDGKKVYAGEKEVSLQEVAYKGTCGNTLEMQVTASYSSQISPPPYMVGAAEVEIDKETGNIDLIDYVAVVDCGTPINPNLARVQTEGGVAQGIGMALMENVQYSKEGKIRENSFMQYKIPSREDIGNIRVEFESSYEKSGPFGAKSIGELVIDTPCPAIADAVYNASGVRVREQPDHCQYPLKNKSHILFLQFFFQNSQDRKSVL